MAYVILVQENDELYGSKKERIMQRQKLVNNLIFVVDPIYKGIDMTDATVMLEYLLPVSKRYETEILTLSNERYNDCFLQYKLPFDTKLTSESGEIQIQLTFVKTELNENGKEIQRVRKTSSTIINVIPITAWSDIIPDSALSKLDERLIKIDAQMRGLNDYMNVLDSNRVDDLVYDDKTETLQLSANGVGIGNKVSIRDMLDEGSPVVDINSDSSNVEKPEIPESPNEDGDSVVEF